MNQHRNDNAVSCRRITDVPPSGLPGDGGIRLRYPIEEAAWVWHPDIPAGQEAFLQFSLPLDLDADAVIPLDISADQRFQLYVDGILVGCGPDRAELNGWAFHRYELALPAGTHELTALVWWLDKPNRPWAQQTLRGGFLCRGLDDWDEQLSTGKAPWTVGVIPGISPAKKTDTIISFHVIGCAFEMTAAAMQPENIKPAAVVMASQGDRTGQYHGYWRLEPTCLPEQQRELFAGGRIRFVAEGSHDHFPTECDEDTAHQYAPLTTGQPLTIPANTELTLLWDLENYICAYPRLNLHDGADSEVQIAWAERLKPDSAAARTDEEDRSVVADRHWLGFGDRFIHDGSSRNYTVPWWRSGRYLRIHIKTSGQPLTITDARPMTTGYPYVPGWSFDSSDDGLPAILSLCEHSLRQCMHETFVDCPYYEQLNYVGDTRVQSLVYLASTRDKGLVRRCLQLFDRSRWFNGFVAERCPSDLYQASGTYSLIWSLMLRDYAWWRDDADTVKHLLTGNRAMLEQALSFRTEQGLLGPLPGWSFVDWVRRDTWGLGIPPRAEDGVSSLLSLHLLLALQAAEQLEIHFGDADLAARYARLADETQKAVFDTFWNEDRGMLADDPQHEHWSQHAQAMALCSERLPEKCANQMAAALVSPSDDMAPASIYFSYYVLEALARMNCGDAIMQRLAFWRALPERGLFTTPEAPPPSRSECHAWGAHPIYFALTAFAGVRPDGPCFDSVRVSPLVTSLSTVQATVPHPHGDITVDLTRNEDGFTGRVVLPDGLTGIYEHGDVRIELQPGENIIA